MDPNQNPGFLKVLRLNRRQVFELLCVAVLFGAGVNLIAAYAANEMPQGAVLAIGAVLSAVAFLFLAGRALWPKPEDRRFVGFFVYDREANEVVPADPRYKLGANLGRYLTAAFAENEAMQAVWDTNPMSGLTSDSPGDPSKSLELVRQAVEYYILSDFSAALTDYFRLGEFDEDELETLSHTDIPNVLLQNRFMKIFAEPMEERSAFLGKGRIPTASPNITSAHLASGALYERFQLVLPKGWKIDRSTSNRIDIRTPRFRLSVATNCNGLDVNIPQGYLRDFLSLDTGPVRYSTLRIDVSVDISSRRAWLVTPQAWKYYRWIDEWITKLNANVSKDVYFSSIGWPAAETTLHMMRQLALSEEGGTSATPMPSPATAESVSESDLVSSGQPTQFRVGDRVEHAAFGEGEIVGSEPGGVVVVRFDSEEENTRKLMWDYAPIRLLFREQPLD
jgi:hypothetical protein